MRGKFFLDTNIFVYSFDSESPAKQTKAMEIINEALSGNKGAISFQVIQEFLNVSAGKFKKPLSRQEAGLYLKEVLLPLCEIYPSSEFYMNVLELKERTGYSFYDAMIVEAAFSGGCNTLFSEDFQHGHKINGLTIKNPFV